jgi:Na+-transporting NADH:ubiquinone oxidoreductase subunit NqrC
MKINKLSLRLRIFISILAIVFFASILILSIVIFLKKEQAKDYHNKRLFRKEQTIKAAINNELERTTFSVTTQDIPSIFEHQIFSIENISISANLRVYSIILR